MVQVLNPTGMSRGWVCPGHGYPPPLLTPSGSHHTYGQQAGGMHRTGILSCCYHFYLVLFWYVESESNILFYHYLSRKTVKVKRQEAYDTIQLATNRKVYKQSRLKVRIASSPDKYQSIQTFRVIPVQIHRVDTLRVSLSAILLRLPWICVMDIVRNWNQLTICNQNVKKLWHHVSYTRKQFFLW